MFGGIRLEKHLLDDGNIDHGAFIVGELLGLELELGLGLGLGDHGAFHIGEVVGGNDAL